MRIDLVEIFRVELPLVRPWRTASGDEPAVGSLLVRMESGGQSAWGEAAPGLAPRYSSEWAAGAFALVRDWLAPRLVGQFIESGAALQERLAPFKGNPFAKAALDTAWWSLEATRRGVPLYQLLGGHRDTVSVGADFDVLDSVGDLLTAIGGAVAAGFPRIKLKFRPGWGLEMLRVVRQEFPRETIHVDLNAGYRLDQMELLARLDDFQLAMLEQPLAADDLVDHARLAQVLRTPICLDESIRSPAHAEQALDLGSCRYVNLKPGRVGGLTPALEIHHACRAAGVACWVGGMLESAVGARLCQALATLDNCTYPADIFPSTRFYAQDLADPPLELVAGPDGAPAARALDLPGIGTAPNPERLAAVCREQAVLRG